MMVVEYKIHEQEPQWRISQFEDEMEAIQYAHDLLSDGFIVRISEE